MAQGPDRDRHGQERGGDRGPARPGGNRTPWRQPEGRHRLAGPAEQRRTLMRPVHIGCAGWAYPHWRERFYPKGVPQRAWLSYYAGRYETVEVNSTFYRLASPAAVAGWVEQTPPGFVFAVQASRYLTPRKRS